MGVLRKTKMITPTLSFPVKRKEVGQIVGLQFGCSMAAIGL